MLRYGKSGLIHATYMDVFFAAVVVPFFLPLLFYAFYHYSVHLSLPLPPPPPITLACLMVSLSFYTPVAKG